MIQLSNLPTEEVFQVTSIIDRDEYGVLLGIEVFLYEEQNILFNKVIEQFRGISNVDTAEVGLAYISIRERKAKRGSGFGRSANIGVSKEGFLSFLRLSWIELGASTPVVDPNIALANIPHYQGIPE
jgi:hypothetical protein